MSLATAPAWSQELVEGGVLLVALVAQKRSFVLKRWSRTGAAGPEAELDREIMPPIDDL
jgi:hypothetical protein